MSKIIAVSKDTGKKLTRKQVKHLEENLFEYERLKSSLEFHVLRCEHCRPTLKIDHERRMMQISKDKLCERGQTYWDNLDRFLMKDVH